MFLSKTIYLVTTPAESVYHSIVLEQIAEMCLKTILLNHNAKISDYILDKYYYRKHGSNAYYGQNKMNN